MTVFVRTHPAPLSVSVISAMLCRRLQPHLDVPVRNVERSVPCVMTVCVRIHRVCLPVAVMSTMLCRRLQSRLDVRVSSV